MAIDREEIRTNLYKVAEMLTKLNIEAHRETVHRAVVITFVTKMTEEIIKLYRKLDG